MWEKKREHRMHYWTQLSLIQAEYQQKQSRTADSPFHCTALLLTPQSGAVQAVHQVQGPGLLQAGCSRHAKKVNSMLQGSLHKPKGRAVLICKAKAFVKISRIMCHPTHNFQVCLLEPQSCISLESIILRRKCKCCK